MMNLLAKTTADNIRHYLRESHMTQTHLAWETGIPYPTLNRKLRNKGDFSLSEVYIIAKALKVSVTALVTQPAEVKPSKEAA